MYKGKYILSICGETIRVNLKNGRGLSQVFDKLGPKVRAMARSYFVEGENNEDKIQNLQVKILQSIPKYKQEKANFYTYICFCLKNFIANEINKNRTKHNVTGFITNYDTRRVDLMYQSQDKKDK